MNMRLAALLGYAVVTEDGRALGHVIDLRARTPQKAQRAAVEDIATVVYGHLGWLERVGLRATEEHTIAWSDIVRIDYKCVVVRSGPRAPARERNPRKARKQRLRH